MVLLSAWLWQGDLVTIGSVAVAIGLVMRMHGMSQWILWEVGALFEAIGTVRDGIETLSRPVELTDRPSAVALEAREGSIAFENVSFGYGKPTPA